MQSDLDRLCSLLISIAQSQPRYNSGGPCLPWWQQGSHAIFGFTFIMITLWLLADHPFCPQLITSYTSEGIVNTVNGYTSHDYDILPLWEYSHSQKIRPPLLQNSIFYVFHINFHKTFLFLILANCVHDESCREKWAPIFPKGQKFVAGFCVHRWRFHNKLNSSSFSNAFIDS